MRGKEGLWVVALALLAALAAARPGQAGQAAAYQAAAAGGDNKNHVSSLAGGEKGIFLKHGLDLKLKVLATGQEMTKAVQAGEAQFLGAAFSNFPVGIERGFKGKGFVGLMGGRTTKDSDEPVAIVTRKGTGITKVQDLAGKKIGTPVGGTGHAYVGVVLKKANVPAEKVNVVNVPPGNSVSAPAGGPAGGGAVWGR